MCFQKKQFLKLNGFPNHFDIHKERFILWNQFKYDFSEIDFISTDQIWKYDRYNKIVLNEWDDVGPFKKNIPHYKVLDKQSWKTTKYELVEVKKYNNISMHCCRILY